MATRSVSVRQVPVPREALALSRLAHVDYADAFVVATESAGERSPEQWARAILADAPLATRTALLSGWSALRLKLAALGSAAAVLGWPVAHSDDDYALLAAESRIGMPAELLVKRQDRGLLFCTQ